MMKIDEYLIYKRNDVILTAEVVDLVVVDTLNGNDIRCISRACTNGSLEGVQSG